jgi:hypothetical protein
MTTDGDGLIRGFKKAFDNEVEVIEILYASNCPNILIYYHLQQAVEKLLKVLYLEVASTNASYSKIKKLGHKVEDISFELISLIGNANIEHFKKLETASSSDYSQLIENTELFNKTVKQEYQIMKDNFINNIRNYENFFNNIYDKYEQYKTLFNNKGGKPVIILAIGGLLTVALYRMNNLPRYPEEDFNYENLDILRSNMHLIPKLVTIFEYWLSLIRSPK